MTDWFGNLSTGDVVYIRMLQNSELWRARVTKRNRSGDIVIQGHGCFCKETVSDAVIEKPRIAIEIEYILQRLSEMRDTHQGTRMCIKVEYGGKEVKHRGFSGKREADRV